MGTSQFIAKRYYRDRLLAAYERALGEAAHATKEVFQAIGTPEFGAANERLAEARKVCNNIRSLALQVFDTVGERQDPSRELGWGSSVQASYPSSLSAISSRILDPAATNSRRPTGVAR